ncbi:hypothetical protein [Vibrio jasicida]|uniref:hypothetical protein n=1 Tax=Vibrio jasicida TaxID=766224 RepID=UPI00163FDEE6|nr:hypothetical protein [Vibrio jasicida]
MQIYTPEIVSLYRYMRTTIVYAVGEEPKPSYSDEALDQLIAENSPTNLNLLHDLIATLDYLYYLKQVNIKILDEELEILKKAVQLTSELRAILQ